MIVPPDAASARPPTAVRRQQRPPVPLSPEMEARLRRQRTQQYARQVRERLAADWHEQRSKQQEQLATQRERWEAQRAARLQRLAEKQRNSPRPTTPRPASVTGTAAAAAAVGPSPMALLDAVKQLDRKLSRSAATQQATMHQLSTAAASKENAPVQQQQLMPPDEGLSACSPSRQAAAAGCAAVAGNACPHAAAVPTQPASGPAAFPAPADPLAELLSELLAAEDGGDPFSIVNLYIEEMLAGGGPARNRPGCQLAAATVKSASAGGGAAMVAVRSRQQSTVQQRPVSAASEGENVPANVRHRRTSSMLLPQFGVTHELLAVGLQQGAVEPLEHQLGAQPAAAAAVADAEEGSLPPAGWEPAAAPASMQQAEEQDAADLILQEQQQQQGSSKHLYIQQWLLQSSAELAGGTLPPSSTAGSHTCRDQQAVLEEELSIPPSSAGGAVQSLAAQQGSVVDAPVNPVGNTANIRASLEAARLGPPIPPAEDAALAAFLPPARHPAGCAEPAAVEPAALPQAPTALSASSRSMSVVTSGRRPGAPLPPGSSSAMDGSSALSGSGDARTPGQLQPVPLPQAMVGACKLAYEGHITAPAGCGRLASSSHSGEGAEPDQRSSQPSCGQASSSACSSEHGPGMGEDPAHQRPPQQPQSEHSYSSISSAELPSEIHAALSFSRLQEVALGRGVPIELESGQPVTVAMHVQKQTGDGGSPSSGSLSHGSVAPRCEAVPACSTLPHSLRVSEPHFAGLHPPAQAQLSQQQAHAAVQGHASPSADSSASSSVVSGLDASSDFGSGVEIEYGWQQAGGSSRPGSPMQAVQLPVGVSTGVEAEVQAAPRIAATAQDAHEALASAGMQDSQQEAVLCPSSPTAALLAANSFERDHHQQRSGSPGVDSRERSPRRPGSPQHQQQQQQRPSSPHALDDRYPGSPPSSPPPSRLQLPGGELMPPQPWLAGPRPLSPNQPNQSSRPGSAEGSTGSRPDSPIAGHAAHAAGTAGLVDKLQGAGLAGGQLLSPPGSSSGSSTASSSTEGVEGGASSPYAMLRFAALEAQQRVACEAAAEPAAAQLAAAQAAGPAPTNADAGSPPATPDTTRPCEDEQYSSCPGSARVEDDTVMQTEEHVRSYMGQVMQYFWEQRAEGFASGHMPPLELEGYLALERQRPACGDPQHIWNKLLWDAANEALAAHYHQALDSYTGRQAPRLALLSREQLQRNVVERVVRWAGMGAGAGGAGSTDLSAMLAENAAEDEHLLGQMVAAMQGQAAPGLLGAHAAQPATRGDFGSDEGQHGDA